MNAWAIKSLSLELILKYFFKILQRPWVFDKLELIKLTHSYQNIGKSHCSQRRWKTCLNIESWYYFCIIVSFSLHWLKKALLTSPYFLKAAENFQSAEFIFVFLLFWPWPGPFMRSRPSTIWPKSLSPLVGLVSFQLLLINSTIFKSGALFLNIFHATWVGIIHYICQNCGLGMIRGTSKIANGDSSESNL